MKLTDRGWILRFRGKRVRLFTDIFSLEADKIISKKLGISLKEAWKIKHIALSSWAPRDLDELRRLYPQVAGEDSNIKLLNLALYSTKLRNPKDRIMGVMLEAVNSAGKTHLAESILEPVRRVSKDLVLDYTRLTGAYLERKFSEKCLDRRIIYIYEARALPYQLHLTISEGRLKIGLSQRVDGEWKPVEIEAEGTPFLLTTTTNWSGNPDFVHRCLLLELDESEEQTRKVIEFHTKLACDHLYREQFEKFLEGCMKAAAWLWKATPENVEVVIPYLPLLEKEMQKVEGLDVRMRRDWKKFLSLLMGSAIIFHKRRPCIQLGDKLIIVSTVDDLTNVAPLMETSFKETFTGLSKKEESVLEALDHCDPPTLTYSELAKITRIPSSTLRHTIIPRLEAKGYVVVERDARPHRIERAPKSALQLFLNLQSIRRKASRLVRKCVRKICQYGAGQYANMKRSSETMLSSENKPKDLAVSENAKDLSVSSGKSGEKEFSTKEKAGELAIPQTAKDSGESSQNKLGEGSISLWQNGHEVKKDGEAKPEEASFEVVAVPITACSQRLGSLLLGPLEFEIQLEPDVPKLLGERWSKLIEDLRAMYGDVVEVYGTRIHVEKNIAGEEVTSLIERLKNILEAALKEREPQKDREIEEREHKPTPKTTRTKVAFLCEDCFQAKKREGKILKDRGKPSGLSVCEICCRNLAEHVVVLEEDEEGGEEGE